MARARTRLTVALAAAAATALLAPVGAAGAPLTANLKGKDEVPGPGAKQGGGSAVIKAKKSQGKVCYELEWRKIAAPNAAHIHKGVAGEAGPIKVPLFTTQQVGEAKTGCVTEDAVGNPLSKKLIKKLKKAPEQFYVNIHNAEFPDGAIRGQLK
jgi:hypothetical protein